jgi:hypothetical protein
MKSVTLLRVTPMRKDKSDQRANASKPDRTTCSCRYCTAAVAYFAASRLSIFREARGCRGLGFKAATLECIGEGVGSERLSKSGPPQTSIKGRGCRYLISVLAKEIKSLELRPKVRRPCHTATRKKSEVLEFLRDRLSGGT